jgi:soluble lytic murein transglycosylase-like protein
MEKKSNSGVVLRERFLKIRRKWIFRFVVTNLVYMIAIAILATVALEKKRAVPPFTEAMQIIEEYRTKDKLYGILRTKGYSLGQGLDIADAIVKKSRELDLPLSLIMAVIHQESEFYPNARSSKGAQGLMQIMPFKWDAYVTKLNLNVDRRAMTDPYMNITVGCEILKDFYDQNKHLTNYKLRMAKTLTDYNNGENAKHPNLNYALQVHQKQGEYEKKLE